jgi:hypothetical protein
MPPRSRGGWITFILRPAYPARLSGTFHPHQNLGPALFETVYELTLARKLEKRGLSVQRQVLIPTAHDGHRFEVDGSRRTLSVPPCLRASVRPKRSMNGQIIR